MSEKLPVIDSLCAWQQALVWGLGQTLARKGRRITCIDADFETWPFDDPTVLESLTGWLRLPQRRLVLLAANYDELPRRQPRFTDWRRNFAHAIDVWQAPEELAPNLPNLLVDDGPVSVQLVDAQRWRGRASLDARAATLWRERVDVVLQRSDPAWPVHTLGL